MKKNKKLLCFGVSFLFLMGSAIAVKQATQNKYSLNAEEGNYNIQLTSDTTVAGLTASYGSGIATVNGVNFNFVTAKTAANKLAVLGNYGYIENFDATSTYKSRVTSIKSINVTFSGSLMIEEGINREGTELGPRNVMSSGTNFDLSATKPYYFRLIAGEGGATIESITINYSCSATSDFALGWLGETYTGKGDDGYTYKLTRNGSNVTVTQLDKEVNASFSGTISMNGTQATCALSYLTYTVDYVVDVSSDGYKLSYVSKTGALASQVAQIDFYKVYEVENFQSYTKAGVGYDNYSGGHAYDTKTGLRASFYCDYYSTGGSTSPLGGTNWNLMASQDYLGYMPSLGRNSSKCAEMKVSTAGSMRYLQTKLFEGNQYIIGKGKTLSLWVHGATKSDGSNSTVSPVMKVFGYYQNKVTASTQQNNRSEAQFTIPAGSDWTQYKVTLDPTKNYYGFSIVFNSSTAACYVRVDDIQIYTEDLYAEYVAPTPPEPGESDKVTMTVLGEATVTGAAASLLGKSSIPVLISLGGVSNTSVAIKVNGSDASATGYTYDKSTGDIEIETTGDVSGLTYGKVTGIVNVTQGKITGLALDGTLSSYVGNNGSIECKEVWGDRCAYSSNAASQQVWQRWYNSTWTANSGSGEWTTSNTTYKMEEDYSMGLRIAGSSYTRTGFTLKQDINGGSGVTARGISIWLYNAGTATYSGDNFRVFGYKTASSTVTGKDYVQPGSTFNTACNGNPSIAPGQWTHIEMGFTECKIYNLRLFFTSIASGTEYVYVGHISLY